MSGDNNTYWKGVPSGMQSGSQPTPTTQPVQPAQPAQPAVQPAQASPYPAPPSPYQTTGVATPTTTVAQPVQPAQPVVQPAQSYTVAPVAQPAAQPVTQPGVYAAPPSPYGVPAAGAAPVGTASSAQAFTQPASYQQAAPAYNWTATTTQTLPYTTQTPLYPVGAIRKISGMAIAGMVLGIVAFLSIDISAYLWLGCTVLGMIFSIIGLSKTSVKRADFQRGRGMAIAGLILSIVNASLLVLAIIVACMLALSGSPLDFDSLSASTQVASYMLPLIS